MGESDLLLHSWQVGDVEETFVEYTAEVSESAECICKNNYPVQCVVVCLDGEAQNFCVTVLTVAWSVNDQ